MKSSTSATRALTHPGEVSIALGSLGQDELRVLFHCGLGNCGFGLVVLNRLRRPRIWTICVVDRWPLPTIVGTQLGVVLVFQQLHELSRAGAESQLAGPVSSVRQSRASSLGKLSWI